MCQFEFITFNHVVCPHEDDDRLPYNGYVRLEGWGMIRTLYVHFDDDDEDYFRTLSGFGPLFGE